MAFAGKPRSYKGTTIPVGARLAREEAITSNINVACHTAFAGKPRSYKGGVQDLRPTRRAKFLRRCPKP